MKRYTSTNTRLSHKNKAIFAAVIAVVVSTVLTGCGNLKPQDNSKHLTVDNNVQLFETLVAQIPDAKNYSSENREQAQIIVSNALETLGLHLASENTAIDEAFINAYLDSHSPEELFKNLFIIYEYVYDRYALKSSDETLFQKYNGIVTNAAMVCEVKIQYIDFGNEGADGYYSQNTGKYPRNKSWTVEGKFYNSSGENVHMEKRTCQATFSYYGDFAVQNETGYKYVPDKYGWYYGVFFNEPPSWKEYNYYSLGYRGKTIIDRKNEYAFWTTARELKYFCVGEKTYLLYGDSTQNDGKTWIELWQ